MSLGACLGMESILAIIFKRKPLVGQGVLSDSELLSLVSIIRTWFLLFVCLQSAIDPCVTSWSDYDGPGRGS